MKTDSDFWSSQALFFSVEHPEAQTRKEASWIQDPSGQKGNRGIGAIWAIWGSGKGIHWEKGKGRDRGQRRWTLKHRGLSSGTGKRGVSAGEHRPTGKKGRLGLRYRQASQLGHCNCFGHVVPVRRGKWFHAPSSLTPQLSHPILHILCTHLSKPLH
eukprot:g78000.t1